MRLCLCALAGLIAASITGPALAAPWGAHVAANPDGPMRRPPPATPPPATPPPPQPWPPIQWPPIQWPPIQWPSLPPPPAPPAQPAPTSPSWQAQPTQTSYEPSIISTGLGFILDVGSLPEVAPGVELWLGMTTGTLRVEMGMNFFVNEEEDQKYQLLAGSGRGCWLLLPWSYRTFRRGPGFSLWGCAGFEIGWRSYHRRETDPAGFETSLNEGDLWGAAHGELEGRYQIARSVAAVLVHAGFAVPFGDPELTGPPEAPIYHSPAPVVGRFGAAFAIGY